jgi:hypothetical protein
MHISTLRTAVAAAALAVTAGAADASIHSTGPNPFPSGSGFVLSVTGGGAICVTPTECTTQVFIQNLQYFSSTSITGGTQESLTATFQASFVDPTNGYVPSGTATLPLVAGTYFTADITGGYNPFTNPIGTFPETLVSASFEGTDSNGNAITAFLNPPPDSTGSVKIIAASGGGFDITNAFFIYAGSTVNGNPIIVPDLGASNISGVPEASTWAMMALGFAGLGFAYRRTRKSALAAA